MRQNKRTPPQLADNFISFDTLCSIAVMNGTLFSVQHMIELISSH
jgi:hypothetical protein